MTRQMHRAILAEMNGCSVGELLSQYERFTAEIKNHVVLALSFEATPETKKVTEIYA